MMKVAYLLGSLNRGGSETLLLDCFQHSDIIPYDIIGIYRKDGILSPAFNQTKPKLIKLSPSYFGDIRYLFRLRKTLKAECVDIVHAQQTLDALYAKLASIGCRRKVVLTFHGFDFANGLIDRIISLLAIKMTDCNIFVSNTQKEYYIKKYRLNSKCEHVVYNGIAFSKLEYAGFSDIRKELGLPAGSLLLSMVGSFVAVRDQMTVCRFLNKLNQEGLDFHFFFIGKKDDVNPSFYDNCADYCQQHNLKDKVFFLGVRDDVPSILTQLDAFIYSSEHDTFGIAVIEAIASGIPVFVNDWEVMKEVTDKGKLAVLYKTKDENDLNQKFKHYMQNNFLYLPQVKQSAIEVKHKFSIENHINSLYKLYKSINVCK